MCADRERDRPKADDAQAALTQFATVLDAAHLSTSRALVQHARMTRHAADYVEVLPRLQRIQAGIERIYRRSAEDQFGELTPLLLKAVPPSLSWHEQAIQLTILMYATQELLQQARAAADKLPEDAPGCDSAKRGLRKLFLQANRLCAELDELEQEAVYQQEEDDAVAAQ